MATMNLISGLTIVGMAFGGAIAQPQHPTAGPRPCWVKIESPKTGDRGGFDLMVTGQAELAPGHSLVVFAGKQGGLFWPQGGGAAKLNPNHEFKVLTTLGEPRDIGSPFDIVVEVLDPAELGKIEEWFAIGRATGKFPGIPLPRFVEGCGEPQTVTVVKSA